MHAATMQELHDQTQTPREGFPTPVVVEFGMTLLCIICLATCIFVRSVIDQQCMLGEVPVLESLKGNLGFAV